MRFLNGLRPGNHRWKVDELAVIFGLCPSPDLLHRLDPLTHQLKAGLEDRTVVLDFLGIPASTHTKEKTPIRYLVDRGDEFCGLDRIALYNEAHASPQLEGFGHRRRCAKHDERVHNLGIGLWKLAPAGKRRPARHWYVGMLGRPHRTRSRAPRVPERAPPLGSSSRYETSRRRNALPCSALGLTVRGELTWEPVSAATPRQKLMPDPLVEIGPGSIRPERCRLPASLRGNLPRLAVRRERRRAPIEPTRAWILR